MSDASKKVYYSYGVYWGLFWALPIPIFSFFTNDAGILFAYYEKFALPSVFVATALGLVFPKGAPLKEKLKAAVMGIMIPAAIVFVFLSNQIKLGIGGF